MRACVSPRREALQNSVGQCLSTCAAHLHATFISQAAQQQQQLQLQQQQSPPPAQQQADGAQEPPRQKSMSSPFSTAAGDQPAPSPTSTHTVGPPVACEIHPLSPQPSATLRCTSTTSIATDAPVSTPEPAAAAAAGSPQQQPLPAAVSPSGGSGSGGGGARSLAAAAVAAMEPRPLARCLRAVQGACEPLFSDTREVTERMAALPSVMSLCAVAFAAPLEL